MVRGTTVTARDIKAAGDIPSLAKQLVGKIANGSVEVRDSAAAMLRSLASQNHGANQPDVLAANAIGPLVALLSTGTASGQESASVTLGMLASGNAETQKAIVSTGGVAPLVALLKMGSAKVQEGAATALAALDADISHQQSIIKAGAIPPLVAMLNGGSAAAQAFAAQTIANAAAYSAEAQRAIAKAGSIPLLLGLLGAGKAQKPAASALATLSHDNKEIQAEITEAGGIAPLLALLNGIDIEAQVSAADALSKMACDNVQTQAAIAKVGGIAPLLALLSSRSAAAQAKGMAALAQLSRNNRDNQDAIAKMAGIKPLIQLLESTSDDVASHAASALMEISRSNADNQQAVVDFGGIGQLANLIKTSTDERVKAEVAGAIWSLSEDPDIKITIAGSNSIPSLVQLLGTGSTRACEHSAGALASLGLDNTKNQVAITQLLIDLLINGSSSAQERAVKALNALVRENPGAHETIAKAGNPAALVELLRSDNVDAKDYSLWSLSLSIEKENQSIISEAGGVQPLITQLSDARVTVEEEAAAALAKLAYDNEETRAAITSCGGVKPLIKLLELTGEGKYDTVRRNSTNALANLATDPNARDDIVSAGGIRPLVLVLDDEGFDTKKYAARALARLSKDHESTQTAIAEAGAIVPLVALLEGTCGPQAQEEAAGALFALADYEGNRVAITESGGIGWLVMLLGCDNPRAREHAEGALVRLSIENANRVLIIKKLVDMLQDSGAAAQEQAAAALANLARESEDNRKSIVDANGIVPLLDVLDSTSSKAKENAVGAIKELCRNSKSNQALVARVGGIPKLVGVMASFSGQTMKDASLMQLCTLAADALQEMAKGNRKNQDAISEAGAIQPLVAMLGSPSPQMQANAAGALANLAHGHPDNQGAIARTGAVAPLCTLVREGSDETKDQSASAIWSLATDHQGNKDTIAKLGGIDPLLGLLVTGTTDRSQEYVAGALAALCSKHMDNRQMIAKRLVGLLGSSAVKTSDRAERVLSTCSSFSSDSAANQVALAKLGGITPLITWLNHITVTTAAKAAHAVLCLATDNATTQTFIAKSDAIPPLITLVAKSSAEAQEYAARALWHLGSQSENRQLITDGGGIKPLIGMLGADGDVAPELAAVILGRLARSNPDVAVEIAEQGGIMPLVKLAEAGLPGAQQQAASVLAELALVPKNRDMIANAQGIQPMINLLVSSAVGTPETAARVLAHIAHEEPDRTAELAAARAQRINMLVRLRPKIEPFVAKLEKTWEEVEPKLIEAESIDALMENPADFISSLMSDKVKAKESSDKDGTLIKGSAERRTQISMMGGIKRLISMLDGSNLTGGKLGGRIPSASPVRKEMGGDVKEKGTLSMPKEETSIKVGMSEQGAIALADIAHKNADMQEAMIECNGVPALLQFIRTGSQLGQEHAARAIWHLAALFEVHSVIVEAGAIVDLVQLLKTGSQKAQEMAAAGISDLALGAVKERQAAEAAEAQAKAKEAEDKAAAAKGRELRGEDSDEISADGPPPEDEKTSDRLTYIAEMGAIVPLVALLSSGTTRAREKAAGALWHLALDRSIQMTIARVNGISPLVTILDDGTEEAHKHAADALARLAIKNADNQAQIAKHCVALLGNNDTGTQRRSACVLTDLAAHNPGSPVVIVNAGAISPLVNLLSGGAPVVKEEAARTLSTLALNSPSTQLAIASGLVALVGTGSADSQEHLTKLLLTLAQDADNAIAIVRAGAIPRLVVQLRGSGHTSTTAQELSTAVLARLSVTEDGIKGIASSNCIRPLVSMLTTGTTIAQAHAAAVLSYLAKTSTRIQMQILSEGAISPLISLLGKENSVAAKAGAAGALLALSSGQPETQKAVVEGGAIRPLVALLSEDDDNIQKKAAGAIAALAVGSTDHQDAIEKSKGIVKLVSLLTAGLNVEVTAEVAATLAVLSHGNRKNQDKVSAAGSIEPLVRLLSTEGGDGAKEDEYAKEAASAALWALASGKHYENQVAIADAGGIPPLVAVLGLTSEKAREQAAGALASLALDNTKNMSAIAQLIVSLLGSKDRQASAKAALAVSRFARANESNQRAIAKAGGVELLVDLLDVSEALADAGQGPTAALAALEAATVQKEMASALWSMAAGSPENQAAIAKAGGIPKLITLLEGHPEVHADTAGALWALSSLDENAEAIGALGGIAPLVGLLSTGGAAAKETAAGALHGLAKTASNRVTIAEGHSILGGGIPLLVSVFDGGSDAACEEAAGALTTLVIQNVPNQNATATEAVEMLKRGSAAAADHVTQLLRNLAQDPENRSAIAKAGAVPELVAQLERGSEKSMGMAAQGLALIALKSAEHRATVTQELVKLLGSDQEAVRQRASEALTDMAADEGAGGSKKSTKSAGVSGVPLVNLLKDGLKDGRVEAQEYALRSLLSISDTPSREAIVKAGCIKPLIESLRLRKLSAVAQEHAATVLSGLAPLGDNAESIMNAKGIEPLVLLLSEGNVDAKEHAADCLAQLARRADAALEIATAGAVSAFVKWLVDPTLGPPEVGARALSEIALDNADTQAQIAEEGAISPLVQMVATSLDSQATNTAITAALKSSNVAALALATLAKDNIVNQVMITEEDGIRPLVGLLRHKTPMHKADSYENPTKALWHLAATEDNQAAIAKAGGIAPLVELLTSESAVSQQYAAAALHSLARDHTENQIALAKAGAIPLLVDILGSDSAATQEHAVGTLLYLASHDVDSRNAVVKRLVGVLDLRNALSQMNAAEALAVLASRSDDNRKAIVASSAIDPLVRLLGDGRRVRAATPQESAAAALADLARLSDSKKSIVDAGGVKPLIAMLSSDSIATQTHASGALWQLAALGTNKALIAESGAIGPLITLLASPSIDAQKFSAGALWHLASIADNKTQMVTAGAIPLLVSVLHSKSPEAREHATAVLSALARSQGGNKKQIYSAGALEPLIGLLDDGRRMTQRHAACCLWALSDGKDGVYDKSIAEGGAIPLLVAMLLQDDGETRGFAAACLLCLCKDKTAHGAIQESGGVDALICLSFGPPTWLRTQVVEMLMLLGVPIPDPDGVPPPPTAVQAQAQAQAQASAAAENTESGRATGMATGKTPRTPGRSFRATQRTLNEKAQAGGALYLPTERSARQPLTGTARSPSMRPEPVGLCSLPCPSFADTAPFTLPPSRFPNLCSALPLLLLPNPWHNRLYGACLMGGG